MPPPAAASVELPNSQLSPPVSPDSPPPPAGAALVEARGCDVSSRRRSWPAVELTAVSCVSSGAEPVRPRARLTTPGPPAEPPPGAAASAAARPLDPAWACAPLGGAAGPVGAVPAAAAAAAAAPADPRMACRQGVCGEATARVPVRSRRVLGWSCACGVARVAWLCGAGQGRGGAHLQKERPAEGRGGGGWKAAEWPRGGGARAGRSCGAHSGPQSLGTRGRHIGIYNRHAGTHVSCCVAVLRTSHFAARVARTPQQPAAMLTGRTALPHLQGARAAVLTDGQSAVGQGPRARRRGACHSGHARACAAAAACSAREACRNGAAQRCQARAHVRGVAEHAVAAHVGGDVAPREQAQHGLREARRPAGPSLTELRCACLGPLIRR